MNWKIVEFQRKFHSLTQCKSIMRDVFQCIQLISVASCVASHRKPKIFNEVSRALGEWIDAKVFQWKAFLAAKVATRECQELNAWTEKQQRLRRVIGKLPVPYKLPEVTAEDSDRVRYQGCRASRCCYEPINHLSRAPWHCDSH